MYDGWNVCLLSQLGGNITRKPSDKRVLPPARVSQKTAHPFPSWGGAPSVRKPTPVGEEGVTLSTGRTPRLHGPRTLSATAEQTCLSTSTWFIDLP